MKKLTVFALTLSLSCTRTVVVKQPGPVVPEEPGLWQVCYDADGEVLDYEGHCQHPREVTWTLPIKVLLPRDTPGHKEIMRALGAWNGWLGADVFVATELDDGEADVEVKLMGPASEGPGLAGMAPHGMRMTGPNAGRPQFLLLLWTPYNLDTAVVAHELGHVLGLFHDPGFPMSVMYPGMAWYLPTLTKHDCRLLVAKYRLPTQC